MPSEGRSSDGLPAGTVLRVQLDARDDRWLARLARSIKRKSGAAQSALALCCAAPGCGYKHKHSQGRLASCDALLSHALLMCIALLYLIHHPGMIYTGSPTSLAEAACQAGASFGKAASRSAASPIATPSQRTTNATNNSSGMSAPHLRSMIMKRSVLGAHLCFPPQAYIPSENAGFSHGCRVDIVDHPQTLKQ